MLLLREKLLKLLAGELIGMLDGSGKREACGTR